ncbi:MAG: LamG domain-containing protein [Victivallales bacterium]
MIKIIFFIFALICGAVTGLLAAQVSAGSEDGLVGYWSFDEGQGDTAKDCSGHANDGKIIGKAKWGKGIRGMALELRGQGYVDCGNNPGLISESITLEAWVRAYGTGYWMGIVSNKKDAYSGGLNLQIGQATNFAALLNGTYLKSLKKPEKDDWYHVAVTYSSSDKKVMLFIDGEIEATEKMELKYSAPDVKTVIGSFYNTGAGDKLFNGLIDEVKIYNRALSPDEIKKEYDSVGKLK